MACDFIAQANEGIQGLQPYQPGKPIEELERELGLSNVVKLASNENPLGAPSSALSAYATAAAQLHLYPDAGGFALKSLLAESLGVESAQLTLGNGSNDVLDLLGRVFLDAESSAVFSQYAFIVYPIAVQAAGAQARVAPAKDWGHDLDAMAALIDDTTRLVFIANPNNPTGTWLDEQALRGFMAVVPENVVVVLDEAYCEYVDEAAYPDSIAMLADYPNLVVTRTFSKAYGLAGLRVGYAISHPDIADLLNRVRAPFNVSVPAMAAAAAAYRDHEYLQQSREVNSAGREQLAAAFDELSLPYIPSVGNFITVEMPSDAMSYYQALLEKGVIVRPIGVYGMPRHLRVSIGLEQENQRFISALKEVLAPA
ncbi:histidinol-phosphate transaminase [Spongiibacter marinus]|uniref:histidinol-phosphate transaminase n=1 Tax=Spongiibacter marinus TaxID=354246 RepID=UPI0004113DDD|nr:histidinol-phosphate transaminase [Spongiibacter marinus]